MLHFEKLTHGFGSKTLFSSVTMTLKAPKIVLTGPNGSGKTTLLLLAAGLIKPQSGKVTFQNQTVLTSTIKSQIGISANKIALPEFFTTKEQIQFHCAMHQCGYPEQLIAQFSLHPFLNTKIDDLSLGNYKKLSLLCAIMHSPKLLLLDEPNNGLDEKTNAALMAYLTQFKGQVIIASHDESMLKGCKVYDIADFQQVKT